MMPYIRSVYLNTGKVKGKFREPEIEYLAGEQNPIVEHKEHGIVFKFDITKIMFSQGNLYERKYLPSLVEEGEIIVDMFAGIGYFSLPLGKLSPARKIYSIELNPIAYQYLVENIQLNDLEEIIEPIQGDSKEEVLRLSRQGIIANRVVMGVFPAPKEFIKPALSLASESGTVYHYEGVVDKDDYLELFMEFKEIAHQVGYKASMVEKRFVKSYGPNLYHTIIDILVETKKEFNNR
jgi:tRNA wybutosine-synthesizing protein 2